MARIRDRVRHRYHHMTMAVHARLSPTRSRPAALTMAVVTRLHDPLTMMIPLLLVSLRSLTLTLTRSLLAGPRRGAASAREQP